MLCNNCLGRGVAGTGHGLEWDTCDKCNGTGVQHIQEANKCSSPQPKPRHNLCGGGVTVHIAALFVETGGSYFGLPGVVPWDQEKDARKYEGQHPVVAHPPCQRWGRFWAGQPLWIARTGQRKKKGDDDGCFKSALESVRRFGGVLEHPWGSHAWPHFGISVPPRKGGWIKADEHGGWTCCIEQGRYGHYARKPTLLYAVCTELPELRWGKSDPVFPQWAIEKYGIEKCKRAGELAFKGGGKDNSHRIGTPPEFRELLLSMARSAYSHKRDW